MFTEARKILLKAALIVAVSAVVAVTTNAVRPDGIPLVTDVPYEIFAPCRDSEVVSEALFADQITDQQNTDIVYVDARPKGAFVAAHAEGALNIPYSALFGAAEQDIARLRKKIAENQIREVVVYGVVEDPAARGEKIELSKSLAEQLTEAGIPGVKYVEGGLATLNKAGVKTVGKVGD